jgi:peptide deformylase
MSVDTGIETNTVLQEALKIHPVVQYPNPVLTRPGAVVTVFDRALETLIAEMFESMYFAGGIGLAAPQINISQQITVIDVSLKKNPDDRLVLINPQVLETKGKQIGEEGCLSVPYIREKVQRAEWVKVKAQNERGEWFEIEGEELLARAILHEIDHLNGVLFIDRISRLKRELALRKYARLQKNDRSRNPAAPHAS